MVRTRVQTGAVQSGTYRNGYGSGSRSFQPLERQMTDSVGNRDGDNGCVYQEVVRKGGLLNGWNGIGESIPFGVRRFENYPSYAHAMATAHPVFIGEPILQAAVNKGAAESNPSRPSIQLPVSLIELRELPRMVLSSYRQGRRPGSNSVAESEFGWAPMISDIQKLFELPDLVESRLRTITSLQSGKISRQRTVWSDMNKSTISENFYEFSGAGMNVVSKVERESVQDCRVTSRWAPSQYIKSIGDVEMARLARRIVTGLEPSQLLVNAWDALPWSWLIDWFSDFGDVLSLSNNSIAYNVGPALATTWRRSKYTFTLKEKPDWVTRSVPSIHLKSWTRQLATPGLPTFNVPLLTTRQTLIISSIALNQRGR